MFIDALVMSPLLLVFVHMGVILVESVVTIAK